MSKKLREVPPDGNCLYAAIADQLNRKAGNDVCFVALNVASMILTETPVYCHDT